MRTSDKPDVGIGMGSQSDWPTLKHAAEILEHLEIPYEARILSAHRTPDRMTEYAKTAESRGIKVIIAGAGGAAHLPGMIAANAVIIPVLGVPIGSKSNNVNDQAALYSIVQMPGGVPVAAFAVGEAGAKNAALQAAAILAVSDPGVRERLRAWRQKLTDQVAEVPVDEPPKT